MEEQLAQNSDKLGKLLRQQLRSLQHSSERVTAVRRVSCWLVIAVACDVVVGKMHAASGFTQARQAAAASLWRWQHCVEAGHCSRSFPLHMTTSLMIYMNVGPCGIASLMILWTRLDAAKVQNLSSNTTRIATDSCILISP